MLRRRIFLFAFFLGIPLHAQTMTLSTYYGAEGSTSGIAIAADPFGNAYQVSTTTAPGLPCSGQLTGKQNVLVTMVDSSQSVVWCTYLGGVRTDYGNGIALDASGSIYVAGMTNSPRLGTPGAYQSSLMGTDDAFVAELNSSGSLQWLTYLGMAGSSQANAIYVDSAGGIYLVGYTTGNAWPVAGGVNQTTYGGGGSDIAIAKLNPGGSSLAWSGYVGGGSTDVGYGLALSPDGSTECVDGYTQSLNYPTTPGAFQSVRSAERAAVVTCVNASTGATVSSTYFGGKTRIGQQCNACAAGVTFDTSGNVWIVGLAQNENGFPITGDAWQPQFGGGLHDAFISELTPDLSTVLYSTWFGGGGDDGAVAPAFDANGNLWIHGNSFSQDLPVTADAFQSANGGPAQTSDAYLLEMSPTGVEYATYLGGSNNEFGGATQSLAVGPGIVWFTGWTQSPDLPLVNAFDGNLDGSEAAFIGELTGLGK